MADQLMFKIFIAACLAVAAWGKPLDQIYKNEKYAMYTDAGSVDENQHSVFVEGKRAMIFRVRACASAHLRMAAIFNHGSVTTDLSIGTQANTKTVLTYKGSGEEVASVDTADILHCNEMRAFWVSWAYGYFRFGRGSALGVGMVLEVQKTGDLDHDVTSINLYTDAGVAGVWEIEDDQFVSLVATPIVRSAELPYPAYTWRTVQHAPGHFMYFTVKACEEVFIYLGTALGASDYSIRMNHGGHNEIWKGSERLAYNTNETVTCNQLRTFWVSWWMGSITLGRGVIKYQNEVIKYDNSGVGNIYALGFAAAPSAKATFDFSATIDELYTFETTSAGDEYQHWLHVAESSFTAFAVEACQSVRVVFSDTLGSVSDNAVILQLNWNGGESQLMKKNGEVLARNSTKVLDCDYLTIFWASFSNNAFRFGTASVKGVSTLLGTTTELDARMTGIGFGSNDASKPARWTVGTIEPGLLRMVTDSNTGEQYKTWASGTKRYYKEFKMTLCSGTATINLTPCLGCQTMGSTGSYHIEISASEVKIMHREGSDHKEIDKYTGTGLTKCNDFLSYFVSWYEGRPVFGKGDLTSGETLVKMTETLPYDVNAIALTSDSKCTWEMDMETGEQLSFQKKDRNQGHNWVKVSPRLTWQRFWVTGAYIEIALSPVYGDSSQGYLFTFNNGPISLQKNGQTVGSYNGNDLIMDKNHRYLMVASWQNGIITLGPETGGNPYIKYEDASPLSVEGIGILPYGDSTELRMPHTFASELGFTTTSNFETAETWMELTHHDTLVFKVKTAQNAEIVLAPFLYHDLITDFYRLIIGDTGNMRTTIKQGNTELAGVDTPYILSASEERTFWVQWYHGEIILGRGEHVGNDVVIAFYDTSPSPITAAGFTGYGNQVTWTVGLVPYGNLAGFTENPSPSGGGLSGGAIAGIVIGCLLLVALIGGFVYMYKFGKMQGFGGSMPTPNMGRGGNQPQQFNNPISYPDTNAMPSSRNSSA